MTQAITTTVVQDITRALVLIVLVIAVIYLSVTGQPVPEGLIGLAGMAFGYFFRDAQENYAQVRLERKVSNGTG